MDNIKTDKETEVYNPTNSNETMSIFKANMLDFEYLEAETKTRFEDHEKSLSFKTKFRIEKDKKIWVSAGMFGLEAARALITPDSVFVINRLEREYYREPISELEEISGLPVDYYSLQNLILGDLLFFNEETAKFEEKEGIIELISESDQLTNVVWLDKGNLQLERQALVDQKNAQEMEISYHNFKEVSNKIFPFESNIHVTGEDEIWVDLEFTKVELGGEPNFDFEINEKYERKTY